MRTREMTGAGRVAVSLVVAGLLVVLAACSGVESTVENVAIDGGVVAKGSSDPTAFISMWDTRRTSTGSSGSNQVKLPLEANGTYNFTVNWGDGSNSTITSWNQTAVTHTYASAGAYTITITGTIHGWWFNNGGDKWKIIEISQWGTLQLGNSGRYFSGCLNLELTATDAPDMTGTTSLFRAFWGCANLGGTGDMSIWDVSNVTSMESMFWNATSFNQSIGSWDVSSVTTMKNMFWNATSFNQLIGTWNVSNVTSMESMFWNATSFNHSIGSWDVSNVKNMENLFYKATSFNQPIGTWNVSSVTNMWGMFSEATSFNQPIGSWDVSNVTTMYGMFSLASSFNQPIGLWNVSKVLTMNAMFLYASSFNQPIGAWNVSSVTNMENMFVGVTLSTANYDLLLLGWSQLSLQDGVGFHAGGSRYSTLAATARQSIITSFGWFIADGGYSPPPNVTEPVDIVHVHGAGGNSISWTINGDDTATTEFVVLRNGTQVATGTWTSGIAFVVPIDNLAVGTYNYTIIATDGLGRSVQDTVIVTVVAAPPISSAPAMIVVACTLAGIVLIVSRGKRRATAILG